MAILLMQKISIYALNKYCKDILETLQRAGVMELEKTNIEECVFYREDTSSLRNSYIRNANTMREAAEILSSYVKPKKSVFSSLEGRIPMSVEEYRSKAEGYSSVLQSAYDIIRDHKRIIENKAKIVVLENSIVSLMPWVNLDVSMKISATKFTTPVIGSFPERLDYEALRLRIAETDSELECFDIEIIFSDENQTCIFAVCLTEEYERFMDAVRKIGFALPAFITQSSPRDAIDDLQFKIDELKQYSLRCKDRIIEKKELLTSLNFFEDYFTMKADQYAQIDNLSYSPHTFVMTGYIPKAESQKLSEMLCSKFDAQVELEDVNEDDVPVILKNSSFTEPVESVVVSYSPPHRKELDPTAVMAVFYYIFFGMMFSDAGYGLVMSLGCFFGIKKFKNMEPGLRKSLKMFFWCGISTFFWGLMFGSFFGDAVKVISNTFFGVEAPYIPGVTAPIWFNPTEGAGPTKLLMFSFLFGIIHLFAGLIMQAVNYIRNGNFIYAVYDDLSWILLVSGAVFALLSTEMLASMAGFRLPAEWMTIGGVLALIGAVLILFCSARNKNPIKRLIKGAYNLYGVTGYLSDILSYSRLLALGLATGVVAQVFNQLGSMFGSGVIGVIGFTLVFVIGHILNIGINALGAYVHTNRLQFVEFFGKFYEGGGREFKPYAIKTKYYNIKEEF